MWWMNGGFHWGWMLFGGLMMLLFWGGLIAIAVLIIRSFAGGGSGTTSSETPGQKTPLQILEERYAKGEITKKEFEAIRADLAG
jgi:putative membrane protein